MYQTDRSQRSFLRELGKRQRGQGKISRFSKRQMVVNKKTGDTKEIRHTGIPFATSGSALKFMARHGIRPGTIITNGWNPPKGLALKVEKNKIKTKTSSLSKKQRDIVMSL
ncbi:hypothetical protein [Flagellimonas sp. CMM7]|uniref:hypothetical protein n=1 Tax=Flagellimonas sp. CMM7 TaxID=2654676 RepID=UPI0013D05E1A|nr:hypothetical protein [Flagellimonas sp. CMM7]UII80060.1 hypothetical protein LV704_00715 [Flagellimonas sp. CMM7]